MQNLKDSLKRLFQPIWGDIATSPIRVKETELRIATKLLKTAQDKKYGVAYELLSHENYHRYIMVVACPDQAFYPDAVRTYLQKQGIFPLQEHTVLFSRADNDSQRLQKPKSNAKDNELLVVFHFAAATTTNIQGIQKDIQHILEGVFQSVSDFSDMLGTLENAAVHLSEDKPDDAALLRWMLENHYLLFGLYYPEHARFNKGICRRKRLLSYLIPNVAEDLQEIATPTQAGMHWLHVTSTFSHMYSHTTVRAVQICWQEHDKLHTTIVIGHFSRSARYTNASHLPQLSNIWEEMSKDEALKQSSFYQREVRMLFDRAPKSLLHSIPVSQWLAPFKAIVDMHQPIATVVQRLKPKQGNFEYLLLAVSSHRYGDNIRHNMQQALQDLGISVWGYEDYSVGATHLIFVAASAETWPHQRSLYHAVQQCVVFWKDKARDILLQKGLAAPLLHDALAQLSRAPTLYQEQFKPEQFVEDIMAHEQIQQDGQVQVRLALLANGEQRSIDVQLLANQAMPLATMTEKLNAFALVTMEQAVVPMQDMHVCTFRCHAPAALHTEGLPRLRQGIADVFNQSSDHDPLNALVILAGLHIRDVLVLIALRNHLAQLMPSVSVGALSQVMIKYKRVSLALFKVFEGKHRPAMPLAHVAQSTSDFKKALADVQNLQEDTWLRALFEIVLASVRSNAWARENNETIAIKVDTSLISFAPHPKPYREIFVHGVFVEGVHLRAGPIARGGLRYSDRPTDFRTEVLELMATQVVKNGQIVPTGAKGGFVVRDGEGADFVLAQYHQFIRALLSITDNRAKGKLVPPQGIRIAEQDKDDAYLVVAADKGTARYSDDANEEAIKAAFWLGDAFASGGSYGYDHKVFGITARGAWMCAAHHFAKVGVDLWQDEVTAVGVGDMGGDVFGNGMLLNPKLKLLAAFNHMHIFLDPKPDVQAAFAERKRLFDAVKGWGDYDASLISQGGGVFGRTAKSIVLSDEVRQILGVNDDKLSGEALIRAILKAPVDLLYNGGIGTYVKASFETDVDAQDPANNNVRVDADSLRCKVLNEGGNLGLTQAARLEFAACGGTINTDAIDNAAGVNMSDHEVNLKILLADVPFKQRNNWLLKAAGDVAWQCLNDNKEQAVALSLAEETAKQHLPRLQHLGQDLLELGYLQAPEEDAKLALRPVLAEWLGHEKNRVHALLDVVSFRKNSAFGDLALVHYFPKVLHKKFQPNMLNHALANDITHTRMASYIVNRYGLTSIHYLQNLTASPVSDIVQAILVADELLGADAMYHMMFPASDNGTDGTANNSCAVADWYVVQQDVINFAAGLLALPNLMGINQRWLNKTKHVLQTYAEVQHKDIVELMPLVTAISLSEQIEKPLEACLKATAKCLSALPFVQLEAVLRTPLWASNEAHALRREWLNRLMLMKVQAAEGLLQTAPKKRERLLKEWKQHPLQAVLLGLLAAPDETQAEDKRRLSYLLALTHLQSIVECECHLV